jgi:hypothetical protein
VPLDWLWIFEGDMFVDEDVEEEPNRENEPAEGLAVVVDGITVDVLRSVCDVLVCNAAGKCVDLMA